MLLNVRLQSLNEKKKYKKDWFYKRCLPPGPTFEVTFLLSLRSHSFPARYYVSPSLPSPFLRSPPSLKASLSPFPVPPRVAFLLTIYSYSAFRVLPLIHTCDHYHISLLAGRRAGSLQFNKLSLRVHIKARLQYPFTVPPR